MSRGRSAPHGFPTANVRYMATPGTREELTSAVDYEGAQVPVREDLRDAHRFLLDRIRSPGTWWTGGERVAIAAEARGAARCALWGAPLPLPTPLAGEPSRHRPAGAQDGGAWVPIIDPADASGPEADLYGGGDFVPNIVRAMSLVPDEVRVLRRSTDAHYVPVAQIPDPTYHRALARPQMELIAARVSALNQCFY